ncbi:hypothetical protein NB689_001888 [Xanthomonas sacchari]|nr:hypothetical protein [Xanthomonas sacchari]MCW0448865.1 hypothetical protein [Xanthomonas sacchari]
MIACATRTSWKSKSSRVPSGSMPEMPITPKSTLNWRISSMVASPVTPWSRPRTRPPATITSKLGLALIITATLRLLVITRRPLWPISARATSSLVVPMLMNSEASSGMCCASSVAMRRFSCACSDLRAV